MAACLLTDAYWPFVPLASLDEPGLFADPEPALFPPGFPVFLILNVVGSITSAGPPRIISPVVWPPDSRLILDEDSGWGLIEPSDPMSLYDPTRVVAGLPGGLSK